MAAVYQNLVYSIGNSLKVIDDPSDQSATLYFMSAREQRKISVVNYDNRYDHIYIEDFSHHFEQPLFSINHARALLISYLTVRYDKVLHVEAADSERTFYENHHFVVLDEEVNKYSTAVSRINDSLRHLEFNVPTTPGGESDVINWADYERKPEFRFVWDQITAILKKELGVEEVTKELFLEHWYWDEATQPRCLLKDAQGFRSIYMKMTDVGKFFIQQSAAWAGHKFISST